MPSGTYLSYITDYTLPAGTVKYARLYVGIYGCGNGAWWVAYNCTDNVTMLSVITASATTGKIDPGFDVWPWCIIGSRTEYNVTNTWGDDDIADEMGNSVDYFDLKHFDISDLINTSDNYATFWWGHDGNNDGTLTEGPCQEGEACVRPVLAVLELDTCCGCIKYDYYTGLNMVSLPLVDSELITTALSSITYDYVARLNSSTKAFEYDYAGAFSTIDPGRGYYVSVNCNCTLIW